MEKLKSNLGSSFITIVKSSLFGLVVSLIGTVVFAVILKFADIPTEAICYVNNVITALSIFVMVLMLKKSSNEKLLLKAVIAGIVYSLLAFVVYSILNGGFNFDLSFLFDLLFAVIVAVVVSIILKLFSKKSA